jgi:hypothetical protein
MSTQSIGLRMTALAAAVLLAAGAAQADPHATNVVSYEAGTGAAAGYGDPNTVLGPPERFTGEGVWPGDVTMFNSAWGTDEIVSIGEGGSLVVQFDHQVMDHSANPFGLDFIVFGNTGFADSSYPNGIAGGLLGNEPGAVRVSQDNVTWYDLVGVEVDTLWPTQGYTDSSGPYADDGTAPSDATKPVDPSLDWNGKTYAQLLAGYDGSAGGTGIDISSTGLSWIQYVEISVPDDAGYSTEIDAFSDVAPEPATVMLVALGAAGTLCRRRRRQ